MEILAGSIFSVKPIDKMIRVPGFLDYGYLLRDPAWDRPRGKPRFERPLFCSRPKDDPPNEL
jgi:hypothetical protein